MFESDKSESLAFMRTDIAWNMNIADVTVDGEDTPEILLRGTVGYVVYLGNYSGFSQLARCVTLIEYNFDTSAGALATVVMLKIMFFLQNNSISVELAIKSVN